MANDVTGGRARRLPAVLGTGLLIFLGLGVMIGAGIFSIAGTQAATMAGPAVIVSFLIAAAVCVLAALSYAELSSTIPTAGSVYTLPTSRSAKCGRGLWAGPSCWSCWSLPRWSHGCGRPT